MEALGALPTLDRGDCALITASSETILFQAGGRGAHPEILARNSIGLLKGGKRKCWPESSQSAN
jgi:hypothetical protein